MIKKSNVKTQEVPEENVMKNENRGIIKIK